MNRTDGMRRMRRVSFQPAGDRGGRWAVALLNMENLAALARAAGAPDGATIHGSLGPNVLVHCDWTEPIDQGETAEAD